MVLQAHTAELDVYYLPEKEYVAVSTKGVWLAKGQSISEVIKDAMNVLQYMV